MGIAIGLNMCKWGAVIGASLAACVLDLRTGRIPNWLTLPLAATGALWAAFTGGLSGLGEAVLAAALLMMPYVVLFVLARGGAGDAKMMGAIGFWLGLKDGFIVLCSVAVAGALLALARVLVQRNRRTALGGLASAAYVFLVTFASGTRGLHLLKSEPQNPTEKNRDGLTIPYGAAIFVGVCIAGGVVHIWKL